ncbi:MAG: GlsB/YeaQ/YmgE family stress response membrane protein [Bryobacteraceae bacterium]|nr:GlsB/YeaQ/YmgE family stress response membrane protein [Bryobacteraceae bacterium]
MLSFMSLVLFGLVVGVIAKLLMPGRDPGGFIVTILLGIAGAVIGAYVGRLMGFYGPNESAGFFMALLGSILLLALYRFAIGRRSVV